MPRKTDSHNPADWFIFIDADLGMLRMSAQGEIAYVSLRSKLAETLEKVMKAELIRLGWTLLKTHDLTRLLTALRDRDSDLVEELDPLCSALAEAYIQNHYPGFDLEDPDWPTFRAQFDAIIALAEKIRARLPASQP